jgi:citrate synthase
MTMTVARSSTLIDTVNLMSSLSAQEAADYLGVSRRTLYAYVSRGLLVSEPSASRERRYPLWSLDELKARRAERREPAAAALRWGTPVLESALTLIDRGQLFYRGQDAVELSRSATFEEVACLLWTGTPEGANQLFPPERMGARSGSLRERLVGCLVDERKRHPLSLTEPTRATLRAAGKTVVALFAAIGATGSDTLAERLARGWRSQHVDHLRAALILCADHELNASAFTARVVAATDAPLPNALLAALCALEGRRHGGASHELSEFLDEIERVGARRAGERAVARHGRMPGLWSGHSIYSDGDPRAIELLRRLDLPARDPAAKAISLMREFGGTPTIELALAALARRARLPRDASFVLFALGRSAGWIAHALEAAGGAALIRPRARYVGPPPTR